MRCLFGVFIAIAIFGSALGYVIDNFEGILIHNLLLLRFLICCRKSAIARLRRFYGVECSHKMALLPVLKCRVYSNF